MTQPQSLALVAEPQAPAPSVTRRQAILDLCVVCLGGVGQVLSHLLPVPSRVPILTVVVVLVAYVAFVLVPRGESLRDYGLRTDNLRRAALEAGVFTAVAGLIVIGIGLALGRSLWRPEIAFMIPLYPLWGIAQQMIFQGIAQRRLLQLASPRVAIVGAAAIYASVHLNNLPLTGLCFLAGLAWSWLYQRNPNVWTVGLSHGVLAALSFPLILGSNPLAKF